mgnify:CR=1 FL=1
MRIKMNKSLVLLTAILLSGCATVEDVRKRLGTFHGLTENDLVQRWGIPSSVYEKDGVRHVQYSQTKGKIKCLRRINLSMNEDWIV